MELVVIDNLIATLHVVPNLLHQTMEKVDIYFFHDQTDPLVWNTVGLYIILDLFPNFIDFNKMNENIRSQVLKISKALSMYLYVLLLLLLCFCCWCWGLVTCFKSGLLVV